MYSSPTQQEQKSSGLKTEESLLRTAETHWCLEEYKRNGSRLTEEKKKQHLLALIRARDLGIDCVCIAQHRGKEPAMFAIKALSFCLKFHTSLCLLGPHWQLISDS